MYQNEIILSRPTRSNTDGVPSSRGLIYETYAVLKWA